jgi:hypothetical protein
MQAVAAAFRRSRIVRVFMAGGSLPEGSLLKGSSLKIPSTECRGRMGVGPALALAMILACSASAGAQSTPGPNSLDSAESSPNMLPDAPLPQGSGPPAPGDSQPVTLSGLPISILKDQAAIWTSPIRFRERDLAWAIPLGLATTLAISADHEAMSTVVSHNSDFNHRNVQASDVLTGGFIAAPVALFGMGQFHGDPHAREAGILGGEAMVDALVVDEGMKLIFLRERPSADGAKGKFFQTGVGTDSSFPSTHSMLAWSSAAVIAAEYPSMWVQIGVYSLATGVSLTRVLGQQHFPSDVLVGSVAGWLVGHYVFRRHHRHGPPGM